MTNPTALATRPSVKLARRPATAPGVYAAEDLVERMEVRLIDIDAEVLGVTESLSGTITVRLRSLSGMHSGVVTRHFLRDEDITVL